MAYALVGHFVSHDVDRGEAGRRVELAAGRRRRPELADHAIVAARAHSRYRRESCRVPSVGE